MTALFSGGYFSMKKGFWGSKISWLFLLHFNFQINKKIIFTVFWSNLEGVGTLCARTQAKPKSPALLGLMNAILWWGNEAGKQSSILLATRNIYEWFLQHSLIGDALKIRVMVAFLVSWSFVIANLVKTGLKLHKHSHMRLLLHFH